MKRLLLFTAFPLPFFPALTLALFIMAGLPVQKAQAQDQWLKGQVTDEQQNGLAYVSIGIAGTSTGTVSGPDGNFQVLIPITLSPTDTLRISHLGYQPLNLPLAKTVGKTAEKLTFVLQPAPQQLATVIIKPVAVKTRNFGTRRENTVISTNFAISNHPFQNLGAAMGKPFNLQGKPHFLKQLNLFVAYNNFDTVVFRLQVHKLKGGKPRESLLQQNIYWTLVKHRKGWATLDLSPYELVLDEKVLISLEWVGHSKKGKYLGIPLAMPLPGSMHYYRFGSQNYWQRYPNMSTSINLVTEVSRKSGPAGSLHTFIEREPAP